MTHRQTALPRRWLMTDERIGNRLWAAIEQLPPGDSGIVLRHHATDPKMRAALARRIADACRDRGIVLSLARDVTLAHEVGAALVHNPAGACSLPFSLSVHTAEEAERARRSGPALVFVSPIHDTRSHAGEPSLGAVAAVGLARISAVPAIALGGMDEEAFAGLPDGAFHGWAGIDAWIRTAG